MASKLVEKQGDFYLAESMMSMTVAKTQKLRTLGSMGNSGVKGLRINMVCAGETFAVDFLQSFQSKKLINALCKALADAQIKYEISGCIPFETVKDRAFITASKQAERYRKTP